ncbi:acetate--CoA ligase family protein [Mogibacterium timidum]
MSIDKLLRPKRVAVIGASEQEGFGGDTCRNIIDIMDKDRYYFVNPNRDHVLGIKCYHSVEEIPNNIDLAVICTPMRTVEDIIKSCAKKGAGGAVVYASGYSEVGTAEGKRAEDSLKKLCDELDVSLMGPNCAGFINYIDEVSSFAFISNKRDRRGHVGFISQSGQLVLSMMDRPGTGFSYVISAGNSKLVTMDDYLDFLVDDEETRVIAMYLEGVKNPYTFVKALKKARVKNKPVVILKTGKSRKAQEIAASHTGSLSGSDNVFDALFEKYGVIRVDDLEELTSTSQAIACLKDMPKGHKLASISLSGGETGICADLGEIYGVEYADLSQKTMDDIKEIIPPYADPNNPLDITATLSYDIGKFSKALEILMKDPEVAMVAIGYTLLDKIADNAIYYMYESMKIVSGNTWTKPMVMVPFVEMSRNIEYVNKLKGIHVPVLPPAQYAFKIISNILRLSLRHPQDYEFIPDDGLKKEWMASEERIALSEYESKKYLEARGIKLDLYDLAKSEDESVEIFDRIRRMTNNPSAKVAVKIDSRDILHKSDIGGVILNLDTGEAVRHAYRTVLDRAERECPEAVINGVQVVLMAEPGVEMIIGVNNDKSFGPTILCGLGGIFVELFKDVSLSIAPLSRKEAENMLYKLKSFKLLDGYRGAPKCNIDDMIDVLIKIADLAFRERESLLELDINPVFVREDGITIADALVVCRGIR